MAIVKGTKINMILMYKDLPVANVAFGLSGIFSSINGFYHKEFMPPGTRVLDDFVEKRFREWIERRSIPTKRPNIKELNEYTKMTQPVQYYFQNRGLSLTDCYWFQTEEQFDMNFGWNEVNYYTNNYSVFSGEKLCNLSPTALQDSFESPNFTTNGKLSKLWVKEGPLNILYKTGTEECCDQEVFNEILAAEIASRLGINHVPYELTTLKTLDGEERFFCKCPDFCNLNWEFVPASSLMIEENTIGKKGFLKYMEENNLLSHIYQMLTLDYLIANRARTTDDFGLIRDTNTLDIVGMAPLFDHGTSLWNNWPTVEIGIEDDAQPFELTHEKQIQMVTDFTWCDLETLEGIEDYARELYSKSKIPEEKQNEIVNALIENIGFLNDIINDNNKQIIIPNNKLSSNSNANNDVIQQPEKRIIISKSDNGFG